MPTIRQEIEELFKKHKIYHSILKVSYLGIEQDLLALLASERERVIDELVKAVPEKDEPKDRMFCGELDTSAGDVVKGWNACRSALLDKAKDLRADLINKD